MTERDNKLLTMLVKDLFNAVDEDDVLTVKGGKLYVQGREVPKEEKDRLAEQAQSLLQSKLWKYLYDDMRYASNKRIYEYSNGVDDMVFGKAMLYCLDILRKKLENVAKM